MNLRQQQGKSLQNYNDLITRLKTPLINSRVLGGVHCVQNTMHLQRFLMFFFSGGGRGGVEFVATRFYTARLPYTTSSYLFSFILKVLTVYLI